MILSPYHSTAVRDLKRMAIHFSRSADRAKTAAERNLARHNAKACRTHAAALIIAERRGFGPFDAHLEACRIQRPAA
jgi:hypothetical protein